MQHALTNAFAGCLIICGLGGCKVEASRCSANEVVATVEQLAGSANPHVARLKQGGVDLAFTLDAIRTVSSSSRAVVCEGRLTIKFHMQLRDAAGHPRSATPQEEAVQAQVFGDRVAEVSYKIEKTDEGGEYVTIIPSDADVNQQGRLPQEDQDRQRQMQEEQRQDADRERAYQQQRDDQQQEECRARQEQLEREEMERQRGGQ